MKAMHSRELVLDSLLAAVWRRRLVAEVLAHSDQDSQYDNDDFKRFCQAQGLVPCISRRGNCWNSAVLESFFSSLKKKRIRKRIYKTRDIARADVLNYIEVFYSRSRRHSYLVASAPRCLSAPGLEVGSCLLQRGQSMPALSLSAARATKWGCERS